MDIPSGAKLIYLKDNSVEVEVCRDSSIQPTPLWTYNGKKLTDIYNETYSVME